MKILTTCLLSAVLSIAPLSQADTVVGEAPDTAVGKGIGGWFGVLIGGAVGGPVGALAVGIVGAWSGGEIQQASGQSGVAYRVQGDDGSETLVRSPNKTWHSGDQVLITGNRLVAAE